MIHLESSLYSFGAPRCNTLSLPRQRRAELCQLTGVKLITYGTVMGGLLSEKFLDTDVSIPFAGPLLNTPSLQKYRRMVDAWGGWSLFASFAEKHRKR